MGSIKFWQILVILGIVLLCMFSSEWWLVVLCGALWLFSREQDSKEKNRPQQAPSEKTPRVTALQTENLPRSNETAAENTKVKTPEPEKNTWVWIFGIVVLAIWIVTMDFGVNVTPGNYPGSSIWNPEIEITPEMAARRQKQLDDMRRAQIAYAEKRARDDEAYAREQARKKAEQERKEAERAKQEARAKREQARKEARANMERRRSGWDCRSVWDGSHPRLVRHIKPMLREPDSFEHISTQVGEAGGGWHKVTMQYRARNGFGGMSIGEVTAEYESGNCGNIRVHSMR